MNRRSVSNTWQRARTKGVGLAFPRIFRIDAHRSDLVRIGSRYGGWWVPSDVLGAESVCYGAGVGTDISFDLGLHERFGCHVYGIDPTPDVISWIDGQSVSTEAFSLIPVGLAKTPGSLRFYEPADPNHVSHSLTNLQRTDRWIQVECRRFAELAQSRGHDHVALLKLDIEGAQHDVVDSLIEDGMLPTVLCVEFDQPERLARTRETVRRIRHAGYLLVKVDWLNMTFLRVDAATTL